MSIAKTSPADFLWSVLARELRRPVQRLVSAQFQVRRKPSAPITYRGSAAAGGRGAAISDRRVLETSLCPHAVPLKASISSVWRESALSRVSLCSGSGEGQTESARFRVSVLGAGERAGVQSKRLAVRHVAMEPWRHRGDISSREYGLWMGSALATRVMQWAHPLSLSSRQSHLLRVRSWYLLGCHGNRSPLLSRVYGQ